MYNRYIRNDEGAYTRILEEEPAGSAAHRGAGPPPPRPSSPPPHPPHFPHPPGEHAEPPRHSAIPDGLTDSLRHFLDRFHLDQIDTGDLLLLGLLYFLFRENADEELLVALGLLLIL